MFYPQLRMTGLRPVLPRREEQSSYILATDEHEKGMLVELLHTRQQLSY